MLSDLALTSIPLLAFLGMITGFVSGFFGVGGGMILVPMLLFAHFEMKQAIAISIMQMVFGSIFGSFLNSKQNKEILKDGLLIGTGGFIGGLFSGIIISRLSGEILQYIFILIVVLSIYRVSITPALHDKEILVTSPVRLIAIGFFIGTIAMSIGVGGSVMLTPILAGFLHYNLKHASSLGLFFVVFSSIAGFISLSVAGAMMFYEGAIVGIGSLFGVYMGILAKNQANIKSYKKFTLILYLIILTSITYKTITL